MHYLGMFTRKLSAPPPESEFAAFEAFLDNNAGQLTLKELGSVWTYPVASPYGRIFHRPRT
ncbi:hypothetical protein ACJX0J_027739, partial [Zea mays]